MSWLKVQPKISPVCRDDLILHGLEAGQHSPYSSVPPSPAGSDWSFLSHTSSLRHDKEALACSANDSDDEWEHLSQHSESSAFSFDHVGLNSTVNSTTSSRRRILLHLTHATERRMAQFKHLNLCLGPQQEPPSVAEEQPKQLRHTAQKHSSYLNALLYKPMLPTVVGPNENVTRQLRTQRLPALPRHGSNWMYRPRSRVFDSPNRSSRTATDGRHSQWRGLDVLVRQPDQRQRRSLYDVSEETTEEDNEPYDAKLSCAQQCQLDD